MHKWTRILISLSLAAAVFFLITPPTPWPALVPTYAVPANHATPSPAPARPSVAPTPTVPPASSPQTSQAMLRVTRVVDGDTIDVQDAQNHQSRVRLLGIDSPEEVDPKTPVQCYAKQAANDASALLLHQTVRLAADPTQSNADKYGRLLRYVYLPNGTPANLRLIQQGDAREYTFKTAYQKQAQFRQAQADAQKRQAGLWSPGTCNGKK